jgi:hypothetical protein
MPAGTSADWNFLNEIGIDLNGLDEELVNNMLIVNAAVLAKAKAGDIAAVKELRDIIGDNAALKHKIRNDNAWLALEREKLSPPVRAELRYHGVPSSLIAPSFSAVHFDIQEHEHTEYVFPG